MRYWLLHCCFRGAFRPGVRGEDPTVGFGAPFHGSGTVVISATDESQLAFEPVPEGAGLPASPQLSVFTAAVVAGVRTKDAGVDRDGVAFAEDLCRYVHGVMTGSGCGQTPRLWLLDGVGSLSIAQ